MRTKGLKEHPTTSPHFMSRNLQNLHTPLVKLAWAGLAYCMQYQRRLEGIIIHTVLEWAEECELCNYFRVCLLECVDCSPYRSSSLLCSSCPVKRL